nr:integrase, catalytic region, zinc finger, CCHC-type, peptidase aspartic, catalytic [Tanacetum cinerariifolium]
MSNQSEDIQAAGSDTRPPMLDRTDFESWQQRIRLYCKGKDHEEYILQSIDEGLFKMGCFRDENATGNEIAQYRAGNANAGQGKPIKYYNYLDEGQLLFLVGGHTNTFDDEVDKGPVQDMAQNEDNIFQADQCDAFDSDVDEAPTAYTMFMANLSSVDPVYDEAGPSYDSNTLSEVQDHDNCLDNMRKDYAKTIKNQSKPGNIRHENESLHQKPDQKAFFYKDQVNEAKCQKIKSSRAILAIYPKSKSKEKGKSKSRTILANFSKY